MTNKRQPIEVEQVAVVGLAGRFPGAPTIQQFWQNLCNGVEARTLFSDDELAASVDPALLAYPGYVKSGFVLDNIDQFDADFFRFDPQQARITDPQQRLFLECVWEALEVAGIDITTYPGLVGVYAGASQSNYWAHARAGMTMAAGNVLAELIGNDKDYLATQTAYRLNLQGPCLSIQSACSTGLVAVHLGCQSLLSHECDVALAGGVTVHVPQRVGYPHVEGSVFAADGRCCAFSAQATGMVFGNGIGVVVLKRLSDALADGDFIWAVVRGSAVNNDGARKFGFMTSSRMGQIEVITEAWGMAGVTAPELSYIETHGSGTPIGDVIEFSALATLFAEVDPSQKACAIGSVKTNVGHLETAAGITGFIKTVLALHHRQLPPSINYATSNPDIDFARTPLYLNTTLTEWQIKPELGQSTRYAGVSSFGIGGTNAHVVLEEAPTPQPTLAETPDLANGPVELPGSDIIIEEIVDFDIVLEEVPVEVEEETPEPIDLPKQPVAPLQLLNFSAKNPQALRALAQRYVDFLAQAPTANFADLCYTAQVGRSHFAQRVSIGAASAQEAGAQLQAFLCEQEQTGPARLHAGMVTEQPKVALRFGGVGANFPDWGRTLYTTQPVFQQAIEQCNAIVAPHLEQSLVAFILATKPHSAALSAAPGVWPYLFALEYATAALWKAWGVEPALVMGQGVGDYVAACVAGVFSLADALKLVIAASKVSQNHQPPFNPVANQITYKPPTIPVIAGATGRTLTSEIATAAYWGQHLATVQAEPQAAWRAGEAARQAHGITCWVESQSDWGQILASLGKLYVAGAPIDWAAFYQTGTHCKVLLPTYPFQRQRYWVDLPESHPSQPIPPDPQAAAQAVVDKSPSGTTTATQTAAVAIGRQLAAAAPTEQRALLVTYLRDAVAQLLAEHAPHAAQPTIPLTVGFAELGMTSLAAVTLRNRLQDDLGYKLPATLVLDYPTITALAEYLMQTLLAPFAVTSATTQPDATSATASWLDKLEAPVQPTALDEEIDALSSDEIAEKLAAKLGLI